MMTSHIDAPSNNSFNHYFYDKSPTSSGTYLSPDVVQRHGGETKFIYEFAPFVILCDRYVSLAWLLFGIPGNICSFAIWSRRKIRQENSSAIYLAALSLNDLCLLALVIVNDLKHAWDVEVINIQGICQLFNVMFLLPQYISPMLVLTFSVERWFAVCYPFQRERYCNPRRAVYTVCCISIITLFLCSIQGYFWTITFEGACQLDDEVTRTRLYEYYTKIVEILISAVVPVMALVFNILLIRELHKIAHRSSVRRSPVMAVACLTNQNASSRSSQSLKRLVSNPLQASANSSLPRPDAPNFRSTTVTLLSVSFFLIFTTLPVGLLYAFQVNSSVPDDLYDMSDEEVRRNPLWERFFQMRCLKAAMDEIALSHFACNFFLYLSTSRLFREQFLQILRCHGRDGLRETHDYIARPTMQVMKQVNLAIASGSRCPPQPQDCLQEPLKPFSPVGRRKMENDLC